MNIFDGPELEFGMWNPRGLNVAEGNKLYKSMLDHGIQRYSIENAIPVLAQPDWFANPLAQATRKGDWPRIKWSDTGKKIRKLKAMGGRHRKFALSMVCDTINAEVQKLHGKLAKLDAATAANSRTQVEYDKKTEEMRQSGEWLIAFYDIGEQSIFSTLQV
jgi:hypothetical protein